MRAAVLCFQSIQNWQKMEKIRKRKERKIDRQIERQKKENNQYKVYIRHQSLIRTNSWPLIHLFNILSSFSELFQLLQSAHAIMKHTHTHTHTHTQSRKKENWLTHTNPKVCLILSECYGVQEILLIGKSFARISFLFSS